MAYVSYNLTQIHFIAPPDNTDPSNQLWNYKSTTDTMATILAAGYFDTVLSMHTGDELLVFSSDDKAQLQVTADNRATGGHLVISRTGNRFLAGQVTTVTAQDTIVTGGATVLAAGATLNDAPVLTCDRATASPGNQAGAPAAGSIYVNSWMPTSNANPTPIAATTFGKKVSWWALVSG